MSQENVEIVRRGYDAFQRGDVETALAPMGEAFVLEDSTRVDTKSEHVGREGFIEWLGEWLSAFEDWQFEVDRVLDRGTQVLVLGRDWGRGKGSGVLVEEDFGHLWSFRDREPTRMLHFNDWSKALEAAGLPE
jgi:ketosteroid isomerase-like protein